MGSTQVLMKERAALCDTFRANSATTVHLPTHDVEQIGMLLQEALDT